MTTKQTGQTTKPSTGHTPGPWHLGVQEEPQETVVGRIPLMASLQYVDTGMRIADIWWSKTNEGRANAAFIVTACNSHYELVQALKLAKGAIDYATNFNVEIPEPYYGAMKAIDQAIAKAEGRG